MSSPKTEAPLRPGRRGRDAMLSPLLDALLLSLGFGLNFWVWLGFIRLGHIPAEYIQLFSWLVAPVVALRIILLASGGLYRTLTPHLGFHELTLIGVATTTTTGALIVFNLVAPRLPPIRGFPLDASGEHLLRLPWGIVFNDWMISLIALGGIRYLQHQYERYGMRGAAADVRRVLIVGTGDAAARVARDLSQQTRGRFVPSGLLDPEGNHAGLRIHGLRVLGGPDNLKAVIEHEKISEVIIAQDQPSPRTVRDIVERLPSPSIQLKIVPDLESLLTGKVTVSSIRPVEIGDLLGRTEVTVGERGVHQDLQGRRVLITGAAGSIGGELARQALASAPASLTLVDISENGLFELGEQLRAGAGTPEIGIEIRVADITQRPSVEMLFQEARPEVVFHAAAHKHVHLMEAQPSEAVRNNVGGTLRVVEAAVRHNVERLVFVSTDKAVHPTGVMGQTKRIGELIVSAMAQRESKNFVSVRFGNVLGSRGSVLPTFQRQIEHGGPVTVTDPEARRYFMTVDEAVSLLIEAGSRGTPGSVLILNMGNPVRIDDLARTLIRLSGFEPERDIEIEYTGLRPGERLNEELVSEEEATQLTERDGIWVAREPAPEWQDIAPFIETLQAEAEKGDSSNVRRLLRECIISTSAPSSSPTPGSKPQRVSGAPGG